MLSRSTFNTSFKKEDNSCNFSKVSNNIIIEDFVASNIINKVDYIWIEKNKKIKLV